MRDLKQNLDLELHLIFPFVLELNPRERRVGVNFKDSKSGFRFDFFALTEFFITDNETIHSLFNQWPEKL